MKGWRPPSSCSIDRSVPWADPHAFTREPPFPVEVDPQGDLGPALPSRLTVLNRAREIETLARRAIEFAGTGPGADLRIALRQFEHIRALLGDAAQEESGLGVELLDDDDMGGAIDG